MSTLNRRVSSSSVFASFFIVMTHNSTVDFRLIYSQLWTKESHQSPNFETFKFSVKNLPNSSYYFPNHKLVFYQILHHSLLSSKITPLYLFRSNVTYFSGKGLIKVQVFENFECSDQNSSNSCQFWNNASVFVQILHQSLVSWDTTPLYFFSWNFLYFQQEQPIKVKIWWNRKSEIWHFHGLLSSI